MHEWNPDWRDIVEPLDVLSMRRMLIASINWIEHYPMAQPEWRESPDATDWTACYEATNDDARRWFTVIADAALGRPSCTLMAKAIAAGITLRRTGWEAFDASMRHRTK